MSFKRRSYNPSPLSSPKSNPKVRHQNNDNSDDDDNEQDDNDSYNIPKIFLDQLATFPLFNNAPTSFHKQVAANLNLIQFHPKEYIIKKGDLSKSMYWILKGAVSVTSTDGETIYAELNPGEFFGEIGILYNRPRTATVIAKTKILLAVLTAESLNTVLKNFPVIERRIRDEAQERLAMQDKKNKEPLSVQSFIKNLPIFQVLPPDIMHKLALSVEPVVHNPFEYILRKGDTCGDIYFIIDGEVEVLGDQGLLEIPVARLSSGSYFGEMSFLNYLQNKPKIRTATIRSVSHCELMVIKSEYLEKLCEDYPAIIEDMKITAEERKIVKEPPEIFKPNWTMSQTAAPPKKRKQEEEYVPFTKRMKMATIHRRRSSALAITTPLPDTILIKIFSYLAVPDMMKLRQVSKRWREMVMTAPLDVLDLKEFNTILTDKALMKITDFVGTRPRVVDISSCFHIGDEGFSYMVNEIGIGGNLKVLRMSSNWEVSGMAIMDLCFPGQCLEEIDLSNCRKVDDDVIERLLSKSHLKILNLGYCKGVTDHVVPFFNNLESLDLTRCSGITDVGFTQMPFSPSLKKLSLKQCSYLTDKAIYSLANVAPNLEVLNLNFCCGLTDGAITAIAMAFPFLREIDLSFCGSAVSDSSLMSLSMMSYLERVLVRGCVRVTRAGMDSLLGGRCPLSYIDISQCTNAHVYPGNYPAPMFPGSLVRVGEKVVFIEF
ncbi:FBXL14 F-box/LRR-repeat protein 14 [Candida maltosa Xu316]